MATIADILAGIDSLVTPAKRRLADMMRNPLRSAEQTVGLLGDRAQTFDQDIGALADRNALRNAGSVMAGLPQYQQAEARTVDRMNSLLGSFAPVGMTVWHGSPHRFDKFDASKIGTGEGAQAYGHGIYVAESPDVAKSYAVPRGVPDIEAIGAKYGVPLSDREMRIELMRQASANPDAATATKRLQYANIEARKQSPEKLQAVIDEWNKAKNASVLYKADLPDDQIAKMLDWDKPLSQQPENVRKFFEPRVAPIRENMAKPAPGWGELSAPQKYDPTGSELLALLRNRDAKMTINTILGNGLGPEISASLRQQGIPGIRYLDGGSRGAGSGTSNFVVFPGLENMLRILERNGEPVK